MRILHINSYYSTGAFYKRLYEAQAAAGEEIRVYVPVPRGYDIQRDFGAFADVVHTHGRYDAAIFQVKHAKILRDARARLQGGAFDVIHAHSLFSNGYIAMKLSEEFGIPYIVAVRDSDVNTFFRRMPHLRPLGRKILRRAAKVVFISEAYKTHALTKYAADEAYLDKSVVLPNGMDDIFHVHRAAAKAAPHAPVRFLFVGLLTPRKNVGAAIDAVAHFRHAHGDAELTVVGKPVSAGELARVKACPFANYHPPVSQRALIDIYRENDIFIVPSKTETFGLVYPEAMSQGLPVLYTRGQGFDGQYAPGEVGYAVAPNDPAEIADAAARILEDYPNISARAVEKCARYDWHVIARAYRGLYEEATK